MHFARRVLMLLSLAAVAAWQPETLVAGGTAQETSETVVAAASQEDPELDAQVKEIASNLRCPTCRALSVYDSPSGMATEMRELIREMLAEGKTADEVYTYFVDRYGEWILLKPKASGFNWTVWLLPIFLLAAGLVFVLTTARRWLRHGEDREAAMADGRD